MKLRCEPGDQAIVIRSKWANFGREVSVIRLLVPGEVLRLDNGLPVRIKYACWLVESRYPLRNDAMAQFGVKPGRLALFPDGNLLPLRPPPADSGAHADKTVEA